MAKFDLVSIGDCAIDAFIQVEEATVHCNINHEDCVICFSFANKIPYKSLHLLSAGNANNVAVGISRLGFKSAFYGSVGADSNGAIILNKLKKEEVNTALMSVQQKIQTNFHIVLWYQSERTILIKHQDFKYALPKAAADTEWIYLTSVGKKGLVLHEPLAKLLHARQNIKMSFNPGTFQLRMGVKKLAPLLQRTEILFVNKEEAALLAGKTKNIRTLAAKLHSRGPRIVVITDGLKGSFASDGHRLYNIGTFPHKPIEATGAGDAYATAFTAAVMSGLDISEAMRWGARNGAAVATKIGPQAGLVTRKEMTAALAKHKNFKAKLVQ